MITTNKWFSNCLEQSVTLLNSVKTLKSESKYKEQMGLQSNPTCAESWIRMVIVRWIDQTFSINGTIHFYLIAELLLLKKTGDFIKCAHNNDKTPIKI